MILRSCIVNNMNAGKNKKQAYNRSRFLPYVQRDTVILDTYSIEDLETVVDVIKTEGINLLILNGGDGTLQMGITELIKHEHVKFLVEIVIVASVLFPVSFAGKSLKFTSLLKYDFIKSILRHIKSSAHIKPSAPFLITRPALRHRRCCSGLLSVP